VKTVANNTIDIFRAAIEWRLQGKPVALATVVNTWGSAPCPVGSHLAINGELEFVGSISGGCIESAVIETALQVMDSGTPRLLEYGVSDEMAWEIGLACGGRIQVYLKPVEIKDKILERLLAEHTAKRRVALLTRLDNGAQCIILSADIDKEQGFTAEELSAAQAGMAADHTGLLDGGRLFLRIYHSPLQLIIVGAVHIAQLLAPMAQLAGFNVAVVDPRRTWLSATRFPNITIHEDWPDRALQQLGLNTRTAAAILSHDPKLDDPALTVALRSSVFYIGALGSRRTHTARLKRLHKSGFNATDTMRIHAPIGLNIGGRSPAEIAVAILAEIIQTMNNGCKASP